MVNIIEIVNNIMGFLKNLNLSKKDIVIILCVLGMAATSWSASHYKGKSNRLEVSLNVIKNELRIEKDNDKIAENVEYVAELQKEAEERDIKLAALYGELDVLRGELISKTKIIEGLGAINDTEDICHAFADLGYPICNKL